MTEIKTYQDEGRAGTFSQIKLDDGNKILISLTQTEIVIFKIGFLGIPKGTVWKTDMYTFLDTIYPEGPLSEDADKSVLQIAVDIALQCGTLEEIQQKFNSI